MSAEKFSPAGGSNRGGKARRGSEKMRVCGSFKKIRILCGGSEEGGSRYRTNLDKEEAWKVSPDGIKKED